MKRTMFVAAVVAAVATIMGLSTPISELDHAEVACSASTPTEIGGTVFRAASMYVSNVGSATAVRIGGNDVTSSTGVSICSSGCDGTGFALDARRAWCLSTSGTVTIDVVYGVQ